MRSFNSPLEAFLYWESHAPNKIFLSQPIDGKIITYSFAEAGVEARKIASALKSHNLSERSHIALLSKNCAHWLLSDIAIMMAGHVSIPIYPTLNSDSIKQILVHSESKAIIVGKLDDFQSQKSGIPEIPIISVRQYGESEGVLWEDIILNEKPLEAIHISNPEDLHTIIYTSGTTGSPKGVMHSVGNFMESTSAFMIAFEFPYNLKMFSYLPLAHVAERLLSNAGIVLGANITFAESLESFASDIQKTQPHILFGVPRIWSKFQEKILESLPQRKLDLLLKMPIINSIIKKKIKYNLGLRDAVCILSAAAPISSSLLKWYQTLGITILQGYGMTEDCCVSHFNIHKANKDGTVGKTLKNVKAKLSAEGEILIKNNCLMKGYYKSPDKTAEVLTNDGYLKTGDIGEYDHDGYLSITGRIKDQFKTDKGKYISPSYLELELSKNNDIEQICVVGTGIPQPIALITLSELGKSKSKTILSKGLIETLKVVNPNFEKHEKIAKVVIMKEDWTVDNGLATPTLKVKRNAIEKIHQEFYKNWFASDDQVIFE